MKKFFFILSCGFLCTAAGFSQKIVYEGGSAFQYGFARLEGNNAQDPSQPTKQLHQYYIDTTGNIVFDTIIKGSFSDKSQWDETDTDSRLLPQSYYTVVSKEGKLGVLTSDGNWLLRPLYDSIDTQYAYEWTVTKGNKKSLFNRKGFRLPFRFEQVWNMNDDYFNITQKGKWGVYCKSKDSVVVPCVYEDMDYCYGCESKGDYCFAEKNGKWGVVDFKNNMLLPFDYDHQHMNMTSGDIVYCLSKNGQQLAINLKTKQTDTCNFNSDNDDDSTVLAHGFIRIKKNNKYGLITPEGKLVLDCAYDYIRYDADTSDLYLPDPYVQISRNDQWGVADTTGKILLSPKYHSVLSFLKIGFFVCETGTQDNNFKEVLTDKSGRQVLSDSYDEITLKYCDSLATPYLLLKKNNRYGIYNPENKTLVSQQFDDIEEYNFDVAYPHAIVIKKENREGILDIASGKIIMPMLYHSIENNHLPDGLMIVYEDEKYGLYDYHKKQLIVPLKYTYIGVTENHRLLKISNGTSYGLMDFEGIVLIPEKYFEIHSLDSSLYALTSEDSTYRLSYSFYNDFRHETYYAPFDTVQAVYSDTLAVVTDKGKFKLWNPLNGKIITGEYAKDGFPDNINYFFYGKVVFSKNGKAGLMDEAGNILIQPVYSGMTNFYHGYALVLDSEKKGQSDNDVAIGDSAWIVQHAVSNISKNTHYGIVDSTGKLIIPVKYDYDELRTVDIYFMDSCFLLIKNTNDYNQLIGLADRNGKEIIPPVYDDITPQKNDAYYMVQKNKKFGVLDKSGNIVLPVIFDNIAVNEAPVYDTKYNFSFPLLAEKDGIWQYYKRNGTTLPIKTKSNIPFDNSVSGY